MQIIDIVFIALLALSVLFGLKKGLILSVAGLLSKIVIVIVAFVLAPVAADFVMPYFEDYYTPPVTEQPETDAPYDEAMMADTLNKLSVILEKTDFSAMAQEEASEALSREIVNSNINISVLKQLNDSGMLSPLVSEALEKTDGSGGLFDGIISGELLSELTSSFSKLITEKVVRQICTFICFIAVFILGSLIFSLITHMLDSVLSSIPVINELNLVLGGVFGILSMVLILSVCAVGINALSLTSYFENSFISSEHLSNTFLFNPLLKLGEAIFGMIKF